MKMKNFLIYLIAISVFSVVICCYDKMAAKYGKQRISEKTLLSVSLFGGAAAMYITMCIIRHKTKHNKFMIGLPIMILVQTAIILLICCEIL